MNIDQIEKLLIKKFKKSLKITFIVFIIMLFFKYVVYNEVILIYIPFIFVLLLFGCISSFATLFKMKKLKKDTELSIKLNHIIGHVAYNYILTENYIIGNYSKKETVKYKDIVLIYYSFSGSKTGIDKILTIIKNNGKKYSFIIDSSALSWYEDEEPKDFSNILLEKNPSILVGKTKENKKILLEKYNIKI